MRGLSRNGLQRNASRWVWQPVLSSLMCRRQASAAAAEEERGFFSPECANKLLKKEKKSYLGLTSCDLLQFSAVWWRNARRLAVPMIKCARCGRTSSFECVGVIVFLLIPWRSLTVPLVDVPLPHHNLMQVFKAKVASPQLHSWASASVEVEVVGSFTENQKIVCRGTGSHAGFALTISCPCQQPVSFLLRTLPLLLFRPASMEQLTFGARLWSWRDLISHLYIPHLLSCVLADPPFLLQVCTAAGACACDPRGLGGELLAQEAAVT